MKHLSPKNLEKALLAANAPRYVSEGDLLSKIYGSSFRMHGFSSPQQRALYKSLLQENATALAHLSTKERFALWDLVWKNSDCFEVLNLPLFYYSDPRHRDEALQVWKGLVGWAARLDNWAHSDGLSSIYARVLEDIGGPLDAQLKLWNSHPNPWLRRQSLVSLYYYSQQRKKLFPVPEALRRVKKLLGDSHYYVQKGVGWTIREAYNVSPKEVLDFVERHLVEIRPEAYTAATEKLNARQKEKFRRQRKEHRKAHNASKMSP